MLWGGERGRKTGTRTDLASSWARASSGHAAKTSRVCLAHCLRRGSSERTDMVRVGLPFLEGGKTGGLCLFGDQELVVSPTWQRTDAVE